MKRGPHGPPDWMRARLVAGYFGDGLTLAQLAQRNRLSVAAVWRVIEQHRRSVIPTAGPDTPQWTEQEDP